MFWPPFRQWGGHKNVLRGGRGGLKQGSEKIESKLICFLKRTFFNISAFDYAQQKQFP
jgi:hypothetical protein